jgi:dTDP-4-amino-4,6-dideoxygalactose transaminase
MNTALKIPYVNLSAQHVMLREELMTAAKSVIESGQFILGEQVEKFEDEFSRICRGARTVAVNSGTDALIMALRALGIGAGDEVITVPNSFIATASAIIIAGARPVFVDVNDDLNMNPDLLEKAITSRTKAVLPVHLTGRPADMYPILEFAKRHRLFVIEDCAQAVLAEYKGKPVGSFGNIGCFSFHPLKTLNACGDGGIVATQDSDLYEKLKLMRNFGLETRDNAVLWSGNSRLDTIQAVFLSVKMKYLSKWTQQRISNAHYYQRELMEVKEIILPFDKPGEKAVYHTFVIQANDRDELMKYLDSQGIKTAVHYPRPIHLQDAALPLGYKEGSFPVAEEQAKKILSLPVYPELQKEDLDYIVHAIKEFYV